MQGIIAGAFGKLERDDADGIIGWHSLVDHMTDVAACFERLSACRSLRRAMEAAAGRVLHEGDIARLSVLAFLHDMGKANSGFQARRWKKLQDMPRGWPRHTGHGIEALKLFEIEALLTLLPVEQMDAWGHACYSLLIAGISHHGRPLKDSPGDWNKNIWKPVADAYDPAAELRGISRRVMAIYPKAFAASNEPLPDAPAFGHLFAGMVQLADWLGSSTVFFPYSEVGEDRAVEAGKLADKAIATIGLDAETYRDRLNADAPTFFEAFGIAAPHPMQTAMADDTLGRLAILESETGSGKTEAALWRYVHLFRAGLVDSLYFALPTRVAASQVYQRVKNTVERLWPENPPLTVRALSGYVSADGAAAHYLPGFEVQWSDHPEDAQAERRWAAESAKRFLAAPLAVGTIDQALLGVLQVRHAHLRYAMLARSLLVVDEVHASDPYMTVLLERLLKAHLGNGGHALLLSATLGSSARSRYLALAAASSRPAAGISFEAACRVPYPAISERAVKAGVATKKVAWKAYDIIDQPEKIARLALDAASRGAKVLVIRNTVPDAIAVFSAIEENIPDKSWLFAVNRIATLHHSRFSRQDRPVMDKAIEAQLGKQRPTGACIVVGTQTLEQSLDIDADLLITDLCPMDVLLQRIGRLHRHANPRPEGFQTAQAWVLTPSGHDLNPLIAKSRHGLGMFHNGGGVYVNLCALEATRLLLAERPMVSIPADNRYLVEAATHPDRLLAIEESKGADWQKLGQKIAGKEGGEKTSAHIGALEISQPFDQQQFNDDVNNATRLGAQDRILHFADLPGPFGEPLRELPVRHHLLPKDLPMEAEPVEIVQTANSIAFRLGDARFCYSRLGLEKLKNEPS